MPRCQVQLKSTDRRSLASLAGRYGGGGSLNPAGGCALAVESVARVSRALAATVIHFMRRKDMVISRLVVGVAGRDLDHASIRHGDGFQEAERGAAARG